MEHVRARRTMGMRSDVIAGREQYMKRSTVMVLLSRMQLDERIRQEALRRAAREARLGEDAAAGTFVRVSGSPKVQSQFFVRRFGHLISRMKLQGA